MVNAPSVDEVFYEFFGPDYKDIIQNPQLDADVCSKPAKYIGANKLDEGIARFEPSAVEEVQTEVDEHPGTISTVTTSATKSADVLGKAESKEDEDSEDEDENEDIYATGYQFPAEVLTEKWPALGRMSVAELAETLQELSYEMTGGRILSYDKVRLKACAISLELNRRGKLAPRFREMRRPPYKIETLEERMLSLDRQFIDLHWLHCTGWKSWVHGERGQFRNLLKTKKFIPCKAEMFAVTPAPFDEKAAWLCLPDHIAFQLAAIQTDEIRKRYTVASQGDIRKGVPRQLGHMQVTALLETSVANQPHLRNQVPRWATIWMCSKLVGEQAEVLRHFHALAEGLDRPLDRRDIARRLEAVKKRLGEVRAEERMAA